MKIINRYIKKQVYLDTFILLVSLIGLVWLTQALRFIKDIATRGLPMGTFFKITLTLLPGPIALILPFCLFAVVLFVYNKMFADRELIVLKSFGMSNRALARPALGAAILMTILSAIIYWWVAPYYAYKTREIQWNFKNDLTSLYIQEGSFNHLNKDVTFYVKEVGEEKIKGVFISDRRRPNSDLTIMAKEGKLVSSVEGVNVILNDGSMQEVNLAKQTSTFAYFDSYNMNMGILDKDSKERGRNLQELYLDEIFDKNGAYYNKRGYRMEGHNRITAPLQVLLFALVALVAVLNGGFDRRGMGFRLFKYTIMMAAIYTFGMGLVGWLDKFPTLTFMLYVYYIGLIIAAFIVLLKGERIKPNLN